jgi:hypothetical protein
MRDLRTVNEALEQANEYGRQCCEWHRGSYDVRQKRLRLTAIMFKPPPEASRRIGALVFVKPTVIRIGWLLGQAEFKLMACLPGENDALLCDQNQTIVQSFAIRIMASGSTLVAEKTTEFYVQCESLYFEAEGSSRA